ncbi:hypothetical protein B0H11DRAFT_1932635 [Mycena galericulata]|nr:hypothetical protein B0H11DRAFT_1932635 [Mycena galericulata]
MGPGFDMQRGNGMFRPARFWPRARKTELPRARAQFSSMISKFDFNSIKRAESSISPQDRTSIASQLAKFEELIRAIIAPREARVAGLKNSQPTLNPTHAHLGLGRTWKPGLGSELVMSLIQDNTNESVNWVVIRRTYEYEIKMRAIKVQEMTKVSSRIIEVSQGLMTAATIASSCVSIPGPECEVSSPEGVKLTKQKNSRRENQDKLGSQERKEDGDAAARAE